jgi:hypothetical protein
MFLKYLKMVLWFIFGMSALLLLLTAIGNVISFDSRGIFANEKELAPYSDPLGEPYICYYCGEKKNTAEELYAGIDKSFEEHGTSFDFVREAVKIYNDGMFFEWPGPRYEQIPLMDNWILYLLSYLDPIIYKIGVVSIDTYFSRYVSHRYERVIERGFGICSQMALGFSDLLNRKYNFDIQIIGLSGHVVSSVVIDNKQVVVDPAVGWYSGKSLLELEKQSDFVVSEYKKLNRPDIPKYYFNDTANITLESIEEYDPRMTSLEYELDYLKYILPLILMAISGLFLRLLIRKN